MRNKKIGWLIVILLAFFSFSYEVIVFSVNQRIKEKLIEKGIKVKHVSTNLIFGKIKVKKGKVKKGKIKFEFSNLDIEFSPLKLLKEEKIDEIVVSGWKFTFRGKSLPDPSFGWIKKVILEEGDFRILFSKLDIGGKVSGKIENIGKGRVGKMDLKGKISPNSPFWIKGEFKMPDLSENIKGKGKINNFSMKGFSGDLSFESKLIKNNFSFNALFEGKKEKIRIKGEGKIPKIQFSFNVEKK